MNAKVLCLCPTFGRPYYPAKPNLVENAIACFLAQTYPAADRQLLIFDDGDQYQSQRGLSWELVTSRIRSASLPEKYDDMLRMEGVLGANAGKYDLVVLWDDDDIYLPEHIWNSVNALNGSTAKAAKPSRILSLYQQGPLAVDQRRPSIESGAGRFHGSLAIKVRALRDLKGWSQTDGLDFDQKMLHLLNPLADSKGSSPQYIYRWETTEAYHNSGKILSDPHPDAVKVEGRLNPRMDKETAAMFRLYNYEHLIVWGAFH